MLESNVQFFQCKIEDYREIMNSDLAMMCKVRCSVYCSTVALLGLARQNTKGKPSDV